MGARERRPLQLYVVPKTHLLVRLLAEHQGTTIGKYMDSVIAAEAAKHGINLGSGTT